MESEETLKQEDTILKAIAELSAKINERLDGHDAQFEAIRQGLVQNSVAFDRLEAEVYKLRADVKNIKADVMKLRESIRPKELV